MGSIQRHLHIFPVCIRLPIDSIFRRLTLIINSATAFCIHTTQQLFIFLVPNPLLHDFGCRINIGINDLAGFVDERF